MKFYKYIKGGITVKAINRGIAWLVIRNECKTAGKKPPCFMEVIEILETPKEFKTA